MLTATLEANCLLWQTSPTAAEIETRVPDWLRQMIGLDEDFTGVIQDSASSAALMAVYASSETHSSVEKDAKVARIGRQFIRQIPVDADFAMRPDALAEAIATDRAIGGICQREGVFYMWTRPGGQRTYSQRLQMDD